MPDWAAWLGLGVSIVSLGGNGVQGILWWIRRKAHERETIDLIALKNSMLQIRAMLTQACDNEDVASTEKMRQFIRHIGHQVRGTEHFVDAMLKAHGVENTPTGGTTLDGVSTQW